MLVPSMGFLSDSADGDGVGDSGAVEHCRHDIDNVVELMTPSTGGADTGRPVHDEAVAGAAEVRGHLLGPLVRRIQRQRPTHRGDGVRVGAADLIDLGEHGLGVVDWMPCPSRCSTVVPSIPPSPEAPLSPRR